MNQNRDFYSFQKNNSCFINEDRTIEKEEAEVDKKTEGYLKESKMDDIPLLIRELQQFDNEKGYRMKYETAKDKLFPIKHQIIAEGDMKNYGHAIKI